jgi:alkylated DNA repair dioxygenase AlkB
MNQIFSTSTAFFSKGMFKDEVLLARCVIDAEPLLEERPNVIIYGKVMKQPRSVGFFSDISHGYRYAKNTMCSKPLTPALSELIRSINSIIGSEFNGILVNKYKDGNDHICAHSDDESRLDVNGVVSISYGAARIFRIRDKATKNIVYDEPTTHCSIFHMGGDFQKIYTHEIPVQKKIKEPRISFTFRKHRRDDK